MLVIAQQAVERLRFVRIRIVGVMLVLVIGLLELNACTAAAAVETVPEGFMLVVVLLVLLLRSNPRTRCAQSAQTARCDARQCHRRLAQTLHQIAIVWPVERAQQMRKMVFAARAIGQRMLPVELARR